MIFELSLGLATTTQRWLRVPRPLFQLSPYTRAVRTDQRDDLTLVDLEGNALDGVDAAVVNVKIVHL